MENNDGNDAEKIMEMSAELSANLIRGTRSAPPAAQSVLAMMTVGRLLGTGYAAELSRSGPDAAHDWMVATLETAESSIRLLGGTIGLVVIRKTDPAS